MAIKVIPMPIAVAMAGGDKAVYMFRSISDDTPLSDLRDATGFIFFENEELPKAEEEPKEEPEKKPGPKKTAPKRKNAGNTNAEERHRRRQDPRVLRRRAIRLMDSRRDEARSSDSHQSPDEDGDLQDQSGKERRMTREEAIKRFQLMKKILSVPNSDAAGTIEAIDMAIEALTKETSTIQEKHQLSNERSEE